MITTWSRVRCKKDIENTLLLKRERHTLDYWEEFFYFLIPNIHILELMLEVWSLTAIVHLFTVLFLELNVQNWIMEVHVISSISE